MIDFEENYLNQKVVWIFWTGKNEMSIQRQRSYNQFCAINKECKVKLITHEIVSKLPNIHEGYQYLSEIQKGDYLKCYFMHHFGGGYSDIKQTPRSWNEYFNRIIEDNDLFAIGYAEKDPGHIALLESCRLDPKKSKYCREFTLNFTEDKWSSEHIKPSWQKLIGNGAFICKKNSPLTKDWWNSLNEKMDGYLNELKENPGKWNRDSYGQINPNTGEKSLYPIPWAVICGNIFHPLTLKYTNHIGKDLPYPVMSNYR